MEKTTTVNMQENATLNVTLPQYILCVHGITDLFTSSNSKKYEISQKKNYYFYDSKIKLHDKFTLASQLEVHYYSFLTITSKYDICNMFLFSANRCVS